MQSIYTVYDTSQIYSPALLFFKEVIRNNLARAIALAGSPARLRPHVKTHKTREIVQMGLAAGITKHKCATLAEAEMLAQCEVPDILLAYNMVGPNRQRLARLIEKYPRSRIAVLADHPKAVLALSQVLVAAGQTVDVLIDLNVGQHRTGIAPGPEAVALYASFAQLPGLRPGGFHVYDGHNHQENLTERETTALRQLQPALDLRAEVERRGLPVPRLVLGGTPTFPVYSKLDLPGQELAPGTCVLHDHGYGSRFTDITGFQPAALLLTRVISRPTPTRITFDLGYKAIASDPPAGKRCILLDMPPYEAVLQNEEHFAIETSEAARFSPGDEVFAVPTHICPTCALHKFAYVIEGGKVTDRWEIVARDRELTI